MKTLSVFYPIRELSGRQLLIFLMLLMAVSYVSTVNAYQLSGVKWPQPSTTFYVDIPGGNGLWNNAFEGAMYEWSAATVFQFYIAPETYSDPCDSNDSRNGVRFASTDCGDEWGSTTIAICHWWYTVSTSTITEADIVFNSNEFWDVYSTSWQSEVNDFRRVAVHELGHAIGLGHEDSRSSIMGTYAGDITIPVKDDIDGIAALYGIAIPAIPTLNSPAANAKAAGTSVNLSWSASSGATQYWLWVRRASDNVVIFSQNIGNRTSYALTGLPNNGNDYFWMVRAGNSGGWSKWTAARRFLNGGGGATTFMDMFDNHVFTNSNWSKLTAVQQLWSFSTLGGSDSGYHVSTTSKELPGAMIANNNTSYHSAGLYVETLVRIDSHLTAYASENIAGLGFVKSVYNGYAVGIELDFDGSNEIDLSIDIISGSTLGRQNLPIKFNTFYKLIFHIDSYDNMRASLYNLDGTLLGSVFARNVLSIDSGMVGIWGRPEATFNNFKLTGNAVD